MMVDEILLFGIQLHSIGVMICFISMVLLQLALAGWPDLRSHLQKLWPNLRRHRRWKWYQ
jgi:uncharacterized membrane protein YidH (DUF202 family)